MSFHIGIYTKIITNNNLTQFKYWWKMIYTQKHIHSHTYLRCMYIYWKISPHFTAHSSLNNVYRKRKTQNLAHYTLLWAPANNNRDASRTHGKQIYLFFVPKYTDLSLLPCNRVNLWNTIDWFKRFCFRTQHKYDITLKICEGQTLRFELPQSSNDKSSRNDCV